ncbi:MAG: hypothetical protein JWM31_2077, partial [Solirubrobacterales bacterium]|nr:hypothetical protein [Solirubrobacterales bacterium]
MSTSSASDPLHLVVVGGGIAALEAVLAVHDLAGSRVRITLIAPEPDFALPPLAVAEPFARGFADPLPLADVMAEHGGVFLRSAVLAVDPAAKTLVLTRDRVLAYDVLLIAHGAAATPALDHALTFSEHPLDLNGILADLEQGWSRSAAFVVPVGCTWPLPLYELALMTAEDVWAMNMDHVELHLITPESAPLAIFGPAASEAVAALLEAAGVSVHCGVEAHVPQGGRIVLGTEPDVHVDRIVALPTLVGRPLAGIPAGADGFISASDEGLVDGLTDVYAVGDATDRPVKQGGLACQQADVVAAHIARRAGADVEVPPLEQMLQGRLLTGGADRFLVRGPGVRGTAGTDPLWWPPVKVS